MGGTKKALRSRPDTTPLTYNARRRGGAKTTTETSQWRVQDVERSVNRCLSFQICISKGICWRPSWKHGFTRPGYHRWKDLGDEWDLKTHMAELSRIPSLDSLLTGSTLLPSHCSAAKAYGREVNFFLREGEKEEKRNRYNCINVETQIKTITFQLLLFYNNSVCRH